MNAACTATNGWDMMAMVVAFVFILIILGGMAWLSGR